MMVISLFIDLKKAFDTVSHEIILMKLEHLGVKNVELDWFKSYLCNRTQVVHMAGLTLTPEKVTVGVPQGALLGVLLFQLIINDLPKCLKFCSSILYADDTTIYLVGRSLKYLRLKVQSDLESLSGWLRLNNLKLNVSKTKSLLFQKQRLTPSFDLLIDGEIIENVSMFKFLGITIDVALKFTDHFCSLYDRLQKTSYIIRKMCKLLPSENMKPLYHALCGSHLMYGMMTWFPMLSKFQQNRLYLMQKRLIRSLCSANYRQHCMPLFKKTAMLTVYDSLFLENCKLMYKIESDIAPIPIRNLYIQHVHSYSTRIASVSVCVTGLYC